MTAAPHLAHRADDVEDLLARADVDALRRLVEQDEFRRDLEPFGEHGLLLVAAAEAAEEPRRIARTDVVALGNRARPARPVAESSTRCRLARGRAPAG